jgi:hypothetical protein
MSRLQTGGGEGLKTCMPYEEEDTCIPYEEEDTCMSDEEVRNEDMQV